MENSDFRGVEKEIEIGRDREWKKGYILYQKGGIKKKIKREENREIERD